MMRNVSHQPKLAYFDLTRMTVSFSFQAMPEHSHHVGSRTPPPTRGRGTRRASTDASALEHQGLCEPEAPPPIPAKAMPPGRELFPRVEINGLMWYHQEEALPLLVEQPLQAEVQLQRLWLWLRARESTLTSARAPPVSIFFCLRQQENPAVRQVICLLSARLP